MKPTEIKNMTEAEINNLVETLKQKLYNLKAESASGRIERPHHIGEIKRDIARCYTILKEKKSGK
ncbi:MAG TPA: 50S ribosomal protein L29 [Candidatus Omnitrophota bacterium]|nr:50S ribosomal protein L29 [Candidatus Omnitrophota bacterium]HPS20238.1 50S ribosomal protein L29 [Candidatus Omnitrophota bacterium]